MAGLGLTPKGKGAVDWFARVCVVGSMRGSGNPSGKQRSTNEKLNHRITIIGGQDYANLRD